MRLRKCSDVFLLDGVYFELIDEKEQAVLDVYKNECNILEVSIGLKRMNLDLLLSLLLDAKRNLSQESGE